MSTFEGPMMAIKTVNSLSHYTDWTIGHVHAGALGWVAMISIGTLYHMIPKLWGRERMHSVGLINAHFWLATIGTVLYIPELLEQPEWAAISAAWWWASHGLNDLADRGEFAAITRRINGGTNGQAERLALWERAKAVLS